MQHSDGDDCSYTLAREVLIWTEKHSRWQTFGHMTAGRRCHTIVQVGLTVLVFGGYKSDGRASNSVEWVDAEQGSSPCAPMPTARANAACAMLDGRVVLLGGRAGQRVVPTVEIYDVTRDSWENAPPLLEAREGATAAVLDGQLVVVGGSEESGAPLRTMEVLTGGSWVCSPVRSPDGAVAFFALGDE